LRAGAAFVVAGGGGAPSEPPPPHPARTIPEIAIAPRAAATAMREWIDFLGGSMPRCYVGAPGFVFASDLTAARPDASARDPQRLRSGY